MKRKMISLTSQSSSSLSSAISQLHNKNKLLYHALIDFFMFSSRDIREEAVVTMVTDKVEADKHEDASETIYNCMKNEDIGMQPLLAGLENYRGGGKPKPTLTAEGDPNFDFIIGLPRKTKRWMGNM